MQKTPHTASNETLFFELVNQENFIPLLSSQSQIYSLFYDDQSANLRIFTISRNEKTYKYYLQKVTTGDNMSFPVKSHAGQLNPKVDQVQRFIIGVCISIFKILSNPFKQCFSLFKITLTVLFKIWQNINLVAGWTGMSNTTYLTKW